jgi:CRISPR system Cascade subunit CasB
MQNRLTDEQFRFIEYLTRLGKDNDRGTLVTLRRGLCGSPVEDVALYRFVARYIPNCDRTPGREEVYYLVAALYGMHPYEAKQGNFGAHMRQVARQRNDVDAAERRFTALLATRLEDLNRPLRQAVALMKQPDTSVPVNWTALFYDLLHWSHPKKITQRAWANSFWGYERPDPNNLTSQNENDPQGE